jgi:hypothetical protein
MVVLAVAVLAVRVLLLLAQVAQHLLVVKDLLEVLVVEGEVQHQVVVVVVLVLLELMVQVAQVVQVVMVEQHLLVVHL